MTGAGLSSGYCRLILPEGRRDPLALSDMLAGDLGCKLDAPTEAVLDSWGLEEEETRGCFLSPVYSVSDQDLVRSVYLLLHLET